MSAILSNSYSSVLSQARLEVLFLRAQIIQDVQVYLSPKDVQNHKNFPKWLQVISPRRHAGQKYDVSVQINGLKTTIHQQAEDFGNTMRKNLDRLESEMNENQAAKIKQACAHFLNLICITSLDDIQLIVILDCVAVVRRDGPSSFYRGSACESAQKRGVISEQMMMIGMKCAMCMNNFHFYLQLVL